MVLRRAAAECPKKVSALVDLVNLPTALREFAGGRSQLSHLSFFLRVWSHIKNNNLQVRALCEKAKEILMEESNVQSGKEIVLKDCGEGSLAVVSELAPKDAIMQLLTQETYSRQNSGKKSKKVFQPIPSNSQNKSWGTEEQF